MGYRVIKQHNDTYRIVSVPDGQETCVELLVCDAHAPQLGDFKSIIELRTQLIKMQEALLLPTLVRPRFTDDWYKEKP